MQDASAVTEVLQEVRPMWVAVPAANPHVDYCQTHPEETRKVNVEGTLNVARACKALGARMVFFSSDYVFDGLKGIYSEEDPTSPLNEYGRQKAQVEAEILKTDPANLVVRTSGAYGWQWEPKNFVLQVRERLQNGQALKVACDVKYNPTYVENLADVTAELVARSCRGIFHVVGPDSLSRYDFACQAASAFGLDASLLEPVPNASFRATTPRPKESCLLTDKVRRRVPLSLWGVGQGLRDMVDFEISWRRYAKNLPPPLARAHKIL